MHLPKPVVLPSRSERSCLGLSIGNSRGGGLVDDAEVVHRLIAEIVPALGVGGGGEEGRL